MPTTLAVAGYVIVDEGGMAGWQERIVTRRGRPGEIRL